jgi:hypothetical protein
MAPELALPDRWKGSVQALGTVDAGWIQIGKITGTDFFGDFMVFTPRMEKPRTNRVNRVFAQQYAALLS